LAALRIAINPIFGYESGMWGRVVKNRAQYIVLLFLEKL
jgi:hypothetical protein